MTETGLPGDMKKLYRAVAATALAQTIEIAATSTRSEADGVAVSKVRKNRSVLPRPCR
jgi:hypothetical protein